MSMFQRVRVCTGSHSTNQQYPCFRVLLSAQAASVNPSTTKPCLCFRVLVYAWSLSVNQSTMCIFQSARVGTGSFIQPVNHVHVSECSCIHGQCQSTPQSTSQPCSCFRVLVSAEAAPVNPSTSKPCLCFRVLVYARAVSVTPSVNKSTMCMFQSASVYTGSVSQPDSQPVNHAMFQSARVYTGSVSQPVNHTMFQSARVYTGSVSQPVNHAMFQSARVYTGSVRADRTVTASVCPDPATPASGARTASWSGSCADGAGCCATCTPSAWSMRQAP